ncbi:lysylphosphatidylglycerol synthase transmembrane domain-containing protein [Salinicola halophilus]|uniref:lysylphosphatidylglycerol synthase transmembrane domain-containing protein n=1 Tax=Salinicola halophilus TaxID=184065 RepID=UPI000DA20D24|nr:lysylphosphatidylglycerol synthase transmembrane domain-containing protein [Salinicola halophilus]
MNRRLAATLRLACTAALLGVLAWQLDTRELLSQLKDLSPGWALLGVLLAVPQVVVSAFRWRLTAHQLGIALRWRRAIREYYLATFLNQVLPGGILGDATRAWRHASDAADNDACDGPCRHGSTQSRAASGETVKSDRRANRGAAVSAVVIERASGQFTLLLVAVTALLLSPELRGALGSLAWPLSATVMAVLGAVGVLAIAVALLARRPTTALRAVASDLRRALLETRIWPRQLASSLLVVATYVAVFLCAAKALGTPRSLAELLPLIPLLLMAMAIPLTVAGWGVREGAAALLWPLAGLPAQEGVTLSVTYGLLILAGSLPGLAVLARGRDRRAAAAPAFHAVSHARAVAPLTSGDPL